MALLGNAAFTMVDLAKRLDPDGKVASIAELLHQTNEILDDIVWQQANDVTSHLLTHRTALPTAYWTRYNQGVPVSKSKTAQVREGMGRLRALTQIDEDEAKLGGQAETLRLSEDMAATQSMNIQLATKLFYGDIRETPAAFNGFVSRAAYNSKTDTQVIDGAGTSTTDCTSFWLVVWGLNTTFCIYPRGSTVGYQMENKGAQRVLDGDSNSYYALETVHKWDCGLAIKDPRSVVRGCNIDVSDLAGTTGANLIKMMIDAIEIIPEEVFRAGRPAFYVNRTIRRYLRHQILDRAVNQLTFDTVAGKRVMVFDEQVPVRRVDALTLTEAALS